MISTKRSVLVRLVPALVAGATISQVSAQEVLWEESFNYQGKVDPTYWSYELGNGCDRPPGCGWGNSELQTYTDLWENVNVTDGNLYITALRVGESTSFTSGRITTQDKVLFKYGQVEARLMVPDIADGLWPALWTLGADYNTAGWPASGEIDMFEMGSGSAIAAGAVNKRVTSGAFWTQADGSLAAYALNPDYEYGDLDNSFFTMRMEWTSQLISTWIIKDGNPDFLVWEMDISETACPDCTEFHQEHFLILNLAVGGFYTSVPSNSSSSSSSSSSSGCTSSSAASSSSSSSGGCNFAARTDITAPLPAAMVVDWIRIVSNNDTTIKINTLPPTPAPSVSAGTAATPAPSVSAGTAASPAPSVSAGTSAPTVSTETFSPAAREADTPTSAPVAQITDPDSPTIDSPTSDSPVEPPAASLVGSGSGLPTNSPAPSSSALPTVPSASTDGTGDDGYGDWEGYGSYPGGYGKGKGSGKGGKGSSKSGKGSKAQHYFRNQELASLKAGSSAPTTSITTIQHLGAFLAMMALLV